MAEGKGQPIGDNHFIQINTGHQQPRFVDHGPVSLDDRINYAPEAEKSRTLAAHMLMLVQDRIRKLIKTPPVEAVLAVNSTLTVTSNTEINVKGYLALVGENEHSIALARELHLGGYGSECEGTHTEGVPKGNLALIREQTIGASNQFNLQLIDGEGIQRVQIVARDHNIYLKTPEKITIVNPSNPLSTTLTIPSSEYRLPSNDFLFISPDGDTQKQRTNESVGILRVVHDPSTNDTYLLAGSLPKKEGLPFPLAFEAIKA